MAKLAGIQQLLLQTQGRRTINHPLAGNLRDFSDSDLQKKITELGKRLVFAHQTGNSQMIGQLEMLMNDYREESSRRSRKQMEAMQENNGKDWDDLIDV